MFRPMRRKKQLLADRECAEILISQKRGALSLIGDDGYPYGIPINFWYDEQNGKICFHGALAGHKIDAIKRCEKASFCVYDEGFAREGEWALNIKSVIAFGKISFVEDAGRAETICRGICEKFTVDEKYIEDEIAKAKNHVLCLELKIEHITGKIVNES